MNHPQEPEERAPQAPEDHLAAAEAALAEADGFGPADPAYLALVLTSVAHSMCIMAADVVEESREARQYQSGTDTGIELASR